MGLFEKFVDKLAKTAKPTTCPRCGETQPRQLKEQVATCSSCGYRASRSEWNFRRLNLSNQPEETHAHPDQPPAGTKIVRRELQGNTIAWEVPASGKGNGLLAFSFLWLGFVTFWTFGASFAAGSSDDPKGILFPLFSIPFWLVGFWMLYTGLRAKYAKHLFLIDAKEVIMVRSLFNRKKRKALHIDTLKWIRKKEFYQQNYTPVYGIEIRGEDGKIRFGTSLSEDEKVWLVADMERVIWPEREATQQTAVAKDPVESQSRESFEVTFPPVPMTGSLVGLIFGFIIVATFLTIGILFVDQDLFRLMWLGINSLFAVIMTWSAIHSWRNRNRSIHVLGNRSEIQVKIKRGGVTVKEEHIPRVEGITVHSYNSGHVNNQPRIHIELIGEEKVLSISKWYPQDLAAEPIRELKRSL